MKKITILLLTFLMAISIICGEIIYPFGPLPDPRDLPSGASDIYGDCIKQLRDKKLKEGLNLATKMVMKYPDCKDCQYLYGFALMNNNRFPEAHTAFTEALRMDPLSPYINFQMAVCLEALTNGKISEAQSKELLTYINRALGGFPKEQKAWISECHYFKADIYGKQGKVDDAMVEIAAFINNASVDPKERPRPNQLAVAVRNLSNKGLWPILLRYWSRVSVEEEKGFYQAMIFKAKPAMESGLEKNPDNCDLRFSYATLLLNLNHFEDAAKQADLLSRKCPKNPVVFSLYVISEQKAGNLKKAEELKKRLVPDSPKPEFLYFTTGRVDIKTLEAGPPKKQTKP